MTPRQLKKYRIAMGFTQVEMARQLGVTERYIQYMESGKKEMPKWFYWAICGLRNYF